MCFTKGNSTVSATVIGYTLYKTKNGREDIYFNKDKNEGRMGGSYQVVLKVYEKKENLDSPPILFQYQYNHLLVDDNSSYCLPFLDSGKDWCVLFTLSYIPST